MRNTWLNTMAAASALCIAASASANPAAMALPGRAPITSPAPVAATPVHVAQQVPVTPPITPIAQPTAPVAQSAAPAVQEEAPRPSSLISPYKHPIQYFRAAMSELPIGWGKGQKDAIADAGNTVMPPVASDSASIASAPTGPASPQQFIVAAQLCEQHGDFAAARQQLGQALAIWPGNVDVLRAAARMEDRAGDLPLAEHLYRQVVAASPQQPGPLNDLGLCLARAGKLEESAQVFEQAIQLQPEKPLYRNNAALVLVEMRQDQRALAHLSAVHGAADANYNLGQLLVQRGRPADAAPFFQAAVEQNPSLQSAHIALARLQGKTTADTAAAAPAARSVTPVSAPQQTTPVGPQLYYPASQMPPYGASSYLPPTYYAPTGQAPAVRPANISTSPRYLPPVASQPGPTRR